MRKKLLAYKDIEILFSNSENMFHRSHDNIAN